MEVVRSALACLPRTAIVSATGQSHSYLDLLAAALAACRKLEGALPSAAATSSPPPATSEPGPRCALFAEPGAEYVAGQFATWLHRGITVPLCLSHPDRELQYILEDAEVSSVLASERHAERMYTLAKPFGADVHVVEAAAGMHESGEAAVSAAAAAVRQGVHKRLQGQRADAGALIIYTSGTTGRPKGALHTHASLLAMVDTLCTAWEWEQADRILHALPLHHVHGIVNALLCPLRTGACVEMLPRFQAGEVWRRLQRRQGPITVHMGVPTMYAQLLHAYDDMAPAQQAEAAAAATRLRLAVSGSAACPTPIMQRWEELSGQRLLERYGMTETGMLLGNPYRGERRPATVGQPFPGVQVRIANSDGSDAGAGPGELRVQGPQLFREYWRRPEATAEAFDAQGFFLTGDTAVLEQGGYYRLLGRTSVDVIKHGGYKISALHVESALLEHPAIAEVAVLGLPDEEYGEQVAAVVALKQQARQAQEQDAQQQQQPGAGEGGGLSLAALREWAAPRLPRYELPRALVVVEAIPRNAMGKVNKKELRAALFPPGVQPAPPTG